MIGLYPIIRRIRRPLLPVDGPSGLLPAAHPVATPAAEDQEPRSVESPKAKIISPAAASVPEPPPVAADSAEPKVKRILLKKAE